MKWKWGIVAIVAALAAVAATNVWAAQRSSVSWPVTCPHMACVNNHLNQLNTRLTAVESRLAALRKRNRTLNACLAEFPVTKQTTYDNWDYPFYNSNLANASEAPGFYNDQSQVSQPIPDILQQTQSGWNVDYWFVRDTCATSTYVRPPAP